MLNDVMEYSSEEEPMKKTEVIKIQKPTKINSKSVENIIKFVQGPEKKKNEKKLSPQQKLQAQIDEHFEKLHELNDEIIEESMNKWQEQEEENDRSP
jgi:hypothetical protein